MSDDVPTFGTVALIEALAEAAFISRGQAQSLLRQLREAYAVDLPLDAEWLRLSAASDEWKPGPSAFYFARPAAWVDYETAYELWSELAQAAASSTESVRIAGWVHAAAAGLALAVDAWRATGLLANVAAKGVALAGFDPETTAACAQRIREVANAVGVQSPVPGLMSTLLQHLTEAIGPETAARLILSEHLADEDRAVVRDLIFPTSTRPKPPSPRAGRPALRSGS